MNSRVDIGWKQGAIVLAGFAMGLLTSAAINAQWQGKFDWVTAASLTLALVAAGVPFVIWRLQRSAEAERDARRHAIADANLAKSAWVEMGILLSLDEIEESLETAFMFRSVHPHPSYMDDLFNLSSFRRLELALSDTKDCSPEILEHANASAAWARRFLSTLATEFPLMDGHHVLRDDASLTSAVLSIEGLRQSLGILTKLLVPHLKAPPVRAETAERLKRMEALADVYGTIDPELIDEDSVRP